MNILLYSDIGVAALLHQLIIKEFADLGLSVTLCNSLTLIQEPWEETTHLLIIPGGRDVAYQEKLGGAANSRIRAFVENGGNYLGICAGAYYGAQSIAFDEGQPLEICAARELGFFPALAKGPAFGPGTYTYHSEKGCKAALIDYNSSSYQATIPLFYNGGCYFVEAHSHKNVEVLARYIELEDSPAAIILCHVGKGKALLTGVHFEQGSSDLLSHNRYHQLIAPRLTLAEEKRKAIFADVLRHLGL